MDIQDLFKHLNSYKNLLQKLENEVYLNVRKKYFNKRRLKRLFPKYKTEIELGFFFIHLNKVSRNKNRPKHLAAPFTQSYKMRETQIASLPSAEQHPSLFVTCCPAQ